MKLKIIALAQQSIKTIMANDVNKHCVFCNNCRIWLQLDVMYKVSSSAYWESSSSKWLVLQLGLWYNISITVPAWRRCSQSVCVRHRAFGVFYHMTWARRSKCPGQTKGASLLNRHGNKLQKASALQVTYNCKCHFICKLWCK